LNAEEHKERQERGHEPALKVGSNLLPRVDGRGVGSRRKAVTINRWQRRGVHRASLHGVTFLALIDCQI
jgi:hypothetical protein